jgi:hypothetical protein
MPIYDNNLLRYATMNYVPRLKLTSCVLAFLLTTSPCYSQDKTPAAQEFALSVLKLFDDGQCSKLYDAFDESARTVSRDQWIKICSTTLRQRGNVVSRSLGNKTKSMGVYRFIFNTQCTEGKVFEDVGVTYRDTEWKLMGFYVRPNLE